MSMPGVLPMSMPAAHPSPLPQERESPWQGWAKSVISEDSAVLESFSLSPGERVGVRASVLRN
jgi:hypothetical protein